MTSINPHANALLEAYNSAMGIELLMCATFERWLVNLHNAGVSSDDLKLCMKARLLFNRTTTCKKGLELKHLCRDEEEIAIVLNEIAVIRASMRIKVMDPAKASVLRATGRPDTLPETEAKRVGDIELIAKLKAAAQ